MHRSVARGPWVLRLLAAGLFAALATTGIAVGTAHASAPPRVVDGAEPTDEAPDTEATDEGEAPEGELIRARVRTDDGVNVAGASITVLQGGETIATGMTDDSGTVEFVVPERGDYTVELDEAALPAEAEGLQPRLNPIETTVNPGTPRTIAFRLGSPGGATDSGDESSGIATNRPLQLAASGLRFGLIIALAAIGLSMIFGTTGLTNFAHGELVTFGALTTYFFNVVSGLHLIPAAALGLVVCGLFGYANDRGLWGPLRKRGTGLIAMMIVSIGLSIFLRYGYAYLVGGSTKTFDQYVAQQGIDLGPISLRPTDLISMGLATVVLLLVIFALLRTRLGKATRAVADNPALAAASGIDVDRVIRVVWIVGTILAGLSGILLGLAQGINYLMGFQILLLIFAAVTLGGLGTAFGALVGSLVVGLFIELSTLIIPTELKNVGALAVLIAILLIRPQGILGRRERIG